MGKKERTEIPPEVAAQILFESDRRCCVCRGERPVQIHHIDENPNNSLPDNLCVLCFDCHLDTQLRGGFNRKLDAAQILLYKQDWLKRVAVTRDELHGTTKPAGLNSAGNQPIRYIQTCEESEEFSYSFRADYPEINVGDSVVKSSVNLGISAFVARTLERFRVEAMSTAPHKREIKQGAPGAIAWDDLSISYDISLFTSDLLSIEFTKWSYFAMAAHPNSVTRTLNFQLRPPVQFELQDIFVPGTTYLEVLSNYCVEDLHRHEPSRFHDPGERIEQLKARQDDWILTGAGPKYRNFERFVFVKGGVRVFFDPYQVGCYAEGRYDVVVPLPVIRSILKQSIVASLD
jgi:hypothetical protein